MKHALDKIGESRIRDDIFNYLRQSGLFVWRDKQAYRKTPPNFPESRGCPDLLGFLKDGRFLAIEVKRPGFEASEPQKVFLKAISDRNHVAFVAHGLSEAIAKLGEA